MFYTLQILLVKSELKMSRNILYFSLMTLIWGTTWVAVKAGVSAVPPLFFGAMRFILVALVMLMTVRGVATAFAAKRAVLVITTGLLVNVATYGFIFWGMKTVASGVSGLTNLSFVAIGLFGFAVLFGQERPTWNFVISLCAGIVGLIILFSDDLYAPGAASEVIGVVAIVIGTLAFCLGSVMSKPLLDDLKPSQLAAAHACVGALGFIAASMAVEGVSAEMFRHLLTPAPVASLLFLVVFGSFVAYPIYLRLVRDWGAPRAGLYAFTSPIIALVLGALVYGEPLGLREVAGASIMLLAAGVAIRSRTKTGAMASTADEDG